MSALTGFTAGEDVDSDASPTLKKLAAASSEVHMLAELTAAMMKSKHAGASYEHAKHRETASRRESFVTDSAATVETLAAGAEGVRRRRSTSRSRGARSSSNASTSTAAGTLLDNLRNSALSVNLRSHVLGGNGHARTVQRSAPGDEVGASVAPSNMASLRRYVDDLSSQLRLARAKQETDAKVIAELQQDNARLKQLVESASEVSDAATASLRELNRTRKTCEELRKEAEGLQRRAKAAERRCEQLQQLYQESKAQYSDVEQRAARAEVAALKSNERVEQVELAAARVEQALAVAGENAQNAERRALRAEQIAAQEQARAADASQRASKAEASASANHERLLDAERRAAKAEVLMEQLQAQIRELEGQLARNARAVEEEASRAADAERRAAHVEHTASAADRRVTRAEEELDQVRALVAAAERRAVLAEDSIGEERARAEAAERRAQRAEQAAEEDRQLALEAERRAGRAVQLQQEAEQRILELERRMARTEQAEQEADARVIDAERQAIRASEAKGAAEARALEAERRLQESQARAAEYELRAQRAQQGHDDAMARITDAERRAARAEVTAEEAVAAMAELEKRVERAEQAAEQDRKGAADADQHAVRAQQALEQAQADALTAERRAARAEKALDEVREQVSAAAARVARAEQLAAQERDRTQEEARHAARMQAAAAQDQQRAREAEERAAAALVRAQKAETRVSAMEGHVEALEARLQQALAQAGAATTRAADADRRCSRLGTETRELRKQLHSAVVQLVESSELHSPLRLQPFSPRRPQQQGDRDGVASPRSVRQESSRAETDTVQDPGAASSPVPNLHAGAPDSGGSRTQLWADACSTPTLEHGSVHNMQLAGGADEVVISQHGSLSARSSVQAGDLHSLGGVVAVRMSSPSRLARMATSSSPGNSRVVASIDQLMDGSVLAKELRQVRAELRSTRQELTDLKSRHSAACSRLQEMEEQAAGMEKLKAKLTRLTAQVREGERLIAEVRSARTQLAEMEGLQLELRKAQAELSEAQSMRLALEDARTQLVEMDRVRSESRRVAAALQTVTRERDEARNELAEASAQLVSMPALRAQLQRAEAGAAEAEQGREAAAAATAAAEAQLSKLRAQLAATEEELAEAVRRAARLQAAADEAAHQRDRVQASLGGAESALRALEEERASLAAAQERLKSKAKELVDAQEELRMLKSQLQEAVAAQRRAAQAEQQAKAQAEEAQAHVSKLKIQLAQATATQVETSTLRQQLQTALAQVQTMKGDLNTAADRLASHAKLQAELAATAERADKAEAQVRGANEDIGRLTAQLEQRQRELAEARQALAKSREELVASNALASSRGGRTAELEHEVAVLREKSYQLEVEVAGMTTELHRLKADLTSASAMIEEAQHARNQLSDQLGEASKQQTRAATAAAAAEERYKADMQQLQMRLAASEAECRSLQHTNGTLHDDLQRAKSDVIALQGQVQDESHKREDLASECRRLQRELDIASEGLTLAQRAQRSVTAGAAELQAEAEQLKASRAAIQGELEASSARMRRLQDEIRELSERNSELASQLHGMSATVRQLEAENARLSDGHATLTVEMEARAAEARAARGEAAELAADRARLTAELQALRAELHHAEYKRPELNGIRDPRITITGGGIPAVSESTGGSPTSRRLGLFGQTSVDVSSPALSPSGTPDDLHALMVSPVDAGALLSDTVDLSQYEALLAALDEEAHQLDEELAGKEASSMQLLQRLRATKQAVTARMDAMQVALQAARETESELRRQAADKDIAILRLQQQLAELGGGIASGAEAAAGVGGAAAAAAGFGSDVLQGNVVISALRQDLDATHERLRDAGRQLREAQERAEAAEAEVGRLREILAQSRAEAAHLRGELAANDKVLGDAEAAILNLVQLRDAAQEAERAAVEAAEALRVQVQVLQAQLDATLDGAPSVPLETEPSGGLAGATHERMVRYLSSLGPDGAPRPSSGGIADHSAFATASSPNTRKGSSARAMPVGLGEQVMPPSPAARRYLPGPRTSDTGSAFSIRQNPSNLELWDGLSASGWDDSAGGRSSGGGVLNPTPVLLPAAGALVSSLPGMATSGLHQLSDVRTGGQPVRSTSGPAAAAAEHADTRPVNRSILEPVPGSSPRAAADGPSATAEASAAAPGTGLRDLQHSGPAGSAAGLVTKARASLAASSSTPSSTPSGTRSGSGLAPEGPQSPASPAASMQRRGAPERSISSTRESLERVIGDLAGRLAPAQTPTRLSAVGLPHHDAPAAADNEPPPRVDPRSPVTGVMTQLSGAALAREEALLAGSDSPAAYPASVASTASNFDLASGAAFAAAGGALSGAGGGASASRAAVHTPAPVSPQSVASSSSTLLVGRPAAVADASSALQSASYRLSPLSAARGSVGITIGSPAAGQDDSHAVTRSGSLPAGGVISSPMLSPRSTLESRTLSRAIRSIGESPGRSALGVSRWSQGASPLGDGSAGPSNTLMLHSSLQHSRRDQPLMAVSSSPILGTGSASRLLSGGRLDAEHDTSKLARRLAAMDDALKSIGAA